MAQAMAEAKRYGIRIDLQHLLQNGRISSESHLPCMCLLLERGASRTFLPDPSHDIHTGDRLLFAGRESARREIAWSLSEPEALIRNATGRTVPQGALWRWFERRRARKQ
jgi:hypothetical protein